ncbi:heparan-alpha-glucosaminide N-acetyltransferase domain-containing protein [Quadrisphaera granulorum]|uniref:heparan-alpha-glucosaminide N-acetyltransferase domain-containing protein n=1 Tax=Quadrisphaera granulorum TaxID=317664 RepID=UPI001FE91339|nr:heparan-alpha-glucosaminide N-acetyltransferase domain-containing protein [Quadrisphaera granulorum]
MVTSSLIAPPDWFEHAPWASVHPLDVVFPAFVVLTGAGLGFAHRRGVRVSRLVRRVVVLIAAGMAYNAAMAWARDGTVDLDTLRWTGVLQLYAALVLVIAVLHLVVRGWIAWTGVALALAGAHTALLARWAVGCPGGEVTPQCNPSLSIDSAVLPTAHLYEQFSLGHDPEGLVALLGACATAAAGTAAAHAITASRASHAAALGRLLTVAVVVAAGAAAAAPLVPAMKRLWTAPFGLGVAAAVVLVVAVVHAVVDAPWVDAPGIERGAGAGALVRSARRPFVALGRNSLLVYFGSHVVAELLLLRPLRPDPTAAPSYAESLGQGLGWLVSDQVGFSAAVLACWWVLATALHRRGWYLRA